MMNLPRGDSANPPRDKRPAPRGSAAYPRKRAVTACQVCRARRTKCDNQRPVCGFCSKTGAKCNYPSDGDDFSAYDPASLRILQRLDDLEGTLRCLPQSIQGAISELSHASHVAVREEDRSWLLPPTPTTLLQSIATVAPNPELLRITSSPVASPHVASQPASSPAAVVDLDPSSSKKLLDNFFNYVHVKNPILQEDISRQMVSRLCLYGVDWSTESCLALLVCALGSIATPFGQDSDVGPGSVAYVTSQSYFRAAQRRLGNCLVKTGILEAQCLFLAGVYQMCVFNCFDAWRLFSQSLSCCQSFTFLRDRTTVANHLEVLPATESLQTAEQTVYWSAWKSELELRNNWHMPDFSKPQVGVPYPTFFPTPPSPTVYHEDDGQHNARAGPQHLDWYFYLTEISLKRLLSGMADDVLQVKARSGESLLDALARSLPIHVEQLEQWQHALPEPISLNNTPELDDVCKFIIRGVVINGYELLYWPYLAHYILQPHSQQAQHDFKHLELATIALSWHRERIRTNKPGFYHRHHGTWFLIESCTRSILMLLRAFEFNLTADFTTQLPMPHDWKDAVIDVIRLNQFWQDEALDIRRRLPMLLRYAEHLGVVTNGYTMHMIE